MNDNESQRLLGELHGKFDQFAKDTTNDIKILQESLFDIQTKFNALQSELSLYKTIVKIVKAILLSIVSVLAFKFGDISSYWHSLFDGK